MRGSHKRCKCESCGPDGPRYYLHKWNKRNRRYAERVWDKADGSSVVSEWWFLGQGAPVGAGFSYTEADRSVTEAQARAWVVHGTKP